MPHYIITFFHTYLVHVGAWGAFYGFMCIKDSKEIYIQKLITIAFLLATFSAMAHNHFMTFLK